VTNSVYNDMAQGVSRLHEIWCSCRRKREQGNLIGWKWVLESAELELDYDIDKVDKEKKTKYRSEITRVDDNILNDEKKGLLQSLYKHLKEKERILRIVQQECGKRTKYSDDEDDWDD
jgi:hypothetical protein